VLEPTSNLFWRPLQLEFARYDPGEFPIPEKPT
jgi:hypothetical protein